VDDLDSDIQDSSIDMNKEEIIHQAVGILRERMFETRKLDGEYYSSSEMTLLAQNRFVDSLVYKTVCWLTDEKLFRDAADVADLALNKMCLNIACDITTACTSIYSPKHLGLAVHLHHDYGSRTLIEELYKDGYCISYTELRCFLSSAATFINTQQQPTEVGVYVPPDIVKQSDGGTQVFMAADNWDHNEHTVDGKRTTHAMTSIFVQPTTGPDIQYPRIPRINIRSLVADSLEGK
jgi:hypothetical protein